MALNQFDGVFERKWASVHTVLRHRLFSPECTRPTKSGCRGYSVLPLICEQWDKYVHPRTRVLAGTARRKSTENGHPSLGSVLHDEPLHALLHLENFHCRSISLSVFSFRCI